MNTPNKITLARIVLIPIYMALMYTGWTQVGGVIFVIASVTDSLDGYLARKNNMVTDLGKFLDPLADKLLVLTAVIILSSEGRIPTYTVILIMAREMIVMSLRMLAASKSRVLAADIYGKVKTIAQLISVSCMHFENLVGLNAFTILVNVIFHFSVVMTVFSGVNYIYKNIDVIQETI
jgi:CDP-diacylglycerol--glycerol-3-phosphate 3-phosphatidyltransferase